MAFDVSALKGRVEEFAQLKLDDREECSAQLDRLRDHAIAAGCKEAFAVWTKDVNRLALTLDHRRKIRESGVSIDSASDTDLAMVLINKLTDGSTRPAIYGSDMVRYSGDGLYEPVKAHDLQCMVQALEGEPYFDERGKPQFLRVSHKRTKDVSAAAVSRVSGSQGYGGLGRGPDWFDAAPHGIMFTNCFLTLEGSRLVSERAGPHHRSTHRHGFAFDPDAKAPKFTRYLSDMLTPEQIPAMLELMGAALFGVGPKYERAGYVKGSPGTGKSTLIKVLKGIMPEGTTGSSEPGSWGDPQFAAGLRGVLLNGVGELRNTHFGDVNTLKSVITGDEMTVKVVYKPVSTFRPRATHIVASNEWARTSNSDRAFWDRWLVFRLDAKRYRGTAEQVIDYHRVLLGEELPGIVALVVEGMARLARQGSYTPIEDDAAREWKGEASNIAVFARECLTLIADAATGAVTPKRKVYERYRHWCQECGYQSLGRNKFYQALEREDGIKTAGRTGTDFNISIIGSIGQSWHNAG